MWSMSGRGFDSRRLQNGMMKFEKEMLLYLVCPVSGGKLELSEDQEELRCKLSHLAYPIVDGIPVLRYDKARDLGGLDGHDGI